MSKAYNIYGTGITITLKSPIVYPNGILLTGFSEKNPIEFDSAKIAEAHTGVNQNVFVSGGAPIFRFRITAQRQTDIDNALRNLFEFCYNNNTPELSDMVIKIPSYTYTITAAVAEEYTPGVTVVASSDLYKVDTVEYHFATGTLPQHQKNEGI